MIKYYCDFCKKEITENRVDARLTCRVLPTHEHLCSIAFHKECIIDFVGKDRIAEMQVESDERKRLAEERRKQRRSKINEE